MTGVAISTLEDMAALYAGFSPSQLSYALSIRPPVSSVTLAMLACVAKRLGVDFKDVIGTQQNDPFYQMSGGPLQTITQFFPLEGTLRLCIDNIEYISQHLPRLNWMVTNGYNLRETGVNAIQDGAFTLGHAFSFFLSASIDFFEEIAKFRAMRRLYARTMKNEFGASNPECWRLRFSVQSAGNTLTTQQPRVNMVRAGIEAMAAVFGGAQSIHLCSYDEGLGLPTEESSRMALRTQQVIAYESGITKTIDPLAGSYYVESLTNRMEQEIGGMLADIDRRGGMVACIRDGWLEAEINAARIRNQRDIDDGKRVLVGVNRFQVESSEDPPIHIHKIRADEWGERRAAMLRRYRADRDPGRWSDAMARIEGAWRDGDNMVPVLMDALEHRVTMGEAHKAMRKAQHWSFR